MMTGAYEGMLRHALAISGDREFRASLTSPQASSADVTNTLLAGCK